MLAVYIVLHVLLSLIIASPSPATPPSHVILPNPKPSEPSLVATPTDVSLVLSIDGVLRALRRSTGDLLWKRKLGDPIVRVESNHVDASDSLTYIPEPAGDGRLFIYDKKNGLRVCSFIGD
jgi:outer membrane protein assembly factor BamB